MKGLAKRYYYILPFIIQSTLWYLLTKPFFSYFLRLEVKGYERISQLGAPIIFAPNHSHELDAVLLPLAFPLWSRFAPLFYVVKESSFYKSTDNFHWRQLFYGGVYFAMLGAFEIRSAQRNYERALADHVAIIKNGGSMCIFPEGGITKDGDFKEAHGGITHLAKETAAWIVPVLITGTYRLSNRELWRRKRRVVIEFLEPIHPQEITTNVTTPETYKRGAERVMDALRKARNNYAV